MSRIRCPHCGNTDRKYIENRSGDDGCSLVPLLCVARVTSDKWSLGSHTHPLPDEYDARGLVPCGMQWDPNEEAA